MKFTDEEIREAYRDAKTDKQIATDLGLPEAARSAHVIMTALMRWANQRKEARKHTGGRRG